MYDSAGNILYPIEGTTVTIENRYFVPGLFGSTYKDLSVSKESYTTDIEGRYQVHFVDKGCYNEEKQSCNLYKISYENEKIFSFGDKYIENKSQNNILILDTIKIIK